MTGALAVLGVGATSPYGLDARQSALFARAAKLAPRSYDLGGDSRTRVGTSRVRRLADDIVGAERMQRLAVSALREAVASAGVDRASPLAAFVALPDPRPWPESEEQRLRSTWLAELFHHAEVRVDLARSETVHVGHAGFALALEHALARGDVAIVGGVDSYHHPAVLADLVESDRLLSETAHGGFVPSEGAAFLVLGPADRSALRRHAVEPAAFVRAVATGVELPKTWEEPRVAELLTDLVYRVADSMHSRPFGWVLSDANGERHRAKERDYLGFRTRELISETDTHETRLAREMGDLGAASGAFAAAHVVEGLKTGFAPADEALIMTSSHVGTRGVFVMGRTR